MRHPFKTPSVAGMVATAGIVAATRLWAAPVIETTSKGVVDTRLISCLDADAFAVADTRRPIVKASAGGPAETGPSGCIIIIR